VSLDDGVFVGSWRNAEFDLRVGSGECGKFFFEKFIIFNGRVSGQSGVFGVSGDSHVQHASGAATIITV
jgi:hypothetical protein